MRINDNKHRNKHTDDRKQHIVGYCRSRVIKPSPHHPEKTSRTTWNEGNEPITAFLWTSFYLLSVTGTMLPSSAVKSS